MQDLYINCVFQPYYEADGTISGSTTLAIDVTYEVMGRKQMEATEKLFQLLADNAPVLIWIADKNKLCTFFNKFWLDFTGRTLEQEQGNGWAEGIHPEDIKRCFDHYSACFDERKEFYMEYRLRRNDGEYRWVSDKGIPNYSPEGEFLGYIGACMDIHDQRTQAKLIKENEEKLKIIIDTSELGIFELNLKTMEPTYSARYLEILGYKDFVQLTHAQILEHLHPDDLPIREEAFKQAFITGTLIYESRVVWKDKSIHWIEGKGKIFYDEENHPVKVMGIVQDITEKKLHQQQLEEREQKFRLLGDSMPQHIWTADIHGNLNYYNQSVFEYTGLTLEDLTRDGWLQIVHPEDREENMLVWMHSIATGEDFLFEHRFRRYDGEYRWQLSRAIPQKDSSGKIKMWVGTSTDIHNQKTFVNELEKQVEDRTRELVLKNMALEKVNQELELFAHISSHDLQEPLRKIQMSTSRILEKDYEILSDKGKQHFKRLQEGAHSIQTLIEDLTSYSRTNSEGDFKELTDLNQVIQEVLHDLKIRIEEKNAIIEVDKLPTLNVFPFQLRQLFHNLIGNALKFSKPNIPPQISITHKIVLGEEVKNAALLPNIKYSCFTVADNGIGFEQKYNQKIFEVFQRLHGKEVYEGSGIGLAIVSKIVENHHGKIIAEGILNIGAKFNIFVPMI